MSYSLLRDKFGCCPLPRAHKRRQGQERQHNSALKKVTILKMKQDKLLDKLRGPTGKRRRSGQLKRASAHKEKELEAKEVRKQCNENFWRFTRELLDGDAVSNIPCLYRSNSSEIIFRAVFLTAT